MIELLNSIQTKSVDTYSINNIGVPSVVLMERAALAVADRVIDKVKGDVKPELRKNNPVLVVCGTGNNGADGLAVARILAQEKIYTDVFIIDDEKEGTEEYRIQKSIVKRLTDRTPCLRCNYKPLDSYNYIVDAIFGVGLNRDVTGINAQVIGEINKSGAYVFSVDAPSGINCTTGRIQGAAVKAAETITFGYNKTGLALEPGRSHAGHVTVADIGFIKEGFERFLSVGGSDSHIVYEIDDDDLRNLPRRNPGADKGKCGKVLIVAGSRTMGGAAVLSAEAALRSGCGLVKVFTHENNRDTLLKNVVESIPVTYNDNVEELADLCQWADCIIAGPGLSTDDNAKAIMGIILDYIANKDIVSENRYVVMDADGLNLLARLHAERSADYRLNSNVIITPHVGEAARLLNTSIDDVKENLVFSAVSLAKEYGCTALLKDAASVITDGSSTYINSSGNPGMATAGSGDVLTGIVAGTICMFKDNNTAYYAALASYIHGKAGDKAKDIYGVTGMKAWDIAEAVSYVLKDIG